MSNRKLKPDRAKTPGSLNSSEYVFKKSATKRYSPNLTRRTNLNETVASSSQHRNVSYAAAGSRLDPLLDPQLKAKLTNYGVNYETEFEFVYNDYLQALMKKQLTEKKIREHEQILKDQLLVQNENLCKRRQKLREIVADTKNYQTKSEIVHIIDILQQNFVSFVRACTENNIKDELSYCKGILNSECDKIVLKNIKTLNNQEEYEQLTAALKSCHSTMQKIINSGRNFKQVHDLAENMSNLSTLMNTVQESQRTISELEKNTLYNFLQNMSDYFAGKYNELSG